ncbi:hypothetical protein PsAD13_03177 [Pseudovibrio sp. Ad13]|uniref:hypothetical protein n=1 Tax=Pseudovibrio sp. Ad13 TaxID=989396 RepID=UPI0007AECE73|nr:hypothetical protein [Pseudovibrio sp. Ad13]KZK82975.1 hypothetical protein PsAD13_03177 [Pseudovibrio sp. Ad13]
MEQIKLNEDALKLVPRIPTQAMMNAGLYQSSHDSEWEDIYSNWVDMVEAAPEHPDEVMQILKSHPSALRSIIEQSMKPLEWEEGILIGAQVPAGEYQIFSPDRVDQDWRIQLRLSPRSSAYPSYEKLNSVKSKEEAKEACQRHHTGQILKLFNLGGVDAKTTKQAAGS